MKKLNKVEVPSSIEKDLTPDSSVWRDGKYMIQKGSIQDTYFIGHETVEVPDEEMDAEGNPTPITRQAVIAFPVVVNKPAGYGDVVDAAERQAYNLHSDSEAISYTASLARKARANAEDPEVVEHDEFIAYVKSELAPIFK